MQFTIAYDSLIIAIRLDITTQGQLSIFCQARVSNRAYLKPTLNFAQGTDYHNFRIFYLWLVCEELGFQLRRIV